MFLDYGKLLNKDNVQKDSVAIDEVTVEDFLKDRVDEYETYHILTNFLTALLNTNENNRQTVASIMAELIGDDDEETVEQAIDWAGEKIIDFLKMLGVSDSTIDDLLDDDEEISETEALLLAEMLGEKVNGDIRLFVAHALNTPASDDVEMDEVQLDWTDYPSIATCKKGSDGKHPIPPDMKCVVGANNGKRVYWRYPIRYLRKGFKKGVKNNHKVSSSKKAHLEKMRKKAHRSIAEQKRYKDAQWRKKAGFSTKIFKGYLKPKSKQQSHGALG